LTCDDGEARPTIPIGVEDSHGHVIRAPFLVDTGADRSALTALQELKLDSPRLAPNNASADCIP
jgi:hypothetical protein